MKFAWGFLNLATAIVSSGANLSTADGTFGKSSTWTRDGGATTVKFPGQVGVLASEAQNFQIFPSGATVIVNGWSKFLLWCNLVWRTIGEQTLKSFKIKRFRNGN